MHYSIQYIHAYSIGNSELTKFLFVGDLNAAMRCSTKCAANFNSKRSERKCFNQSFLAIRSNVSYVYRVEGNEKAKSDLFKRKL